jgi:ribosomal protein S18 acetylase RimI-like enzyme
MPVPRTPVWRMSTFSIRSVRPDDQAAAYYICLKTGDHGRDGEPFYRDDPDALGRIFVGPYMAFEPQLGLILEDEHGICGYAFGCVDSRAFYARYESEWRPQLCASFPMPQGDPATWSRAQTVHSWYHEPDYYCPEPYEAYPSHMHIDLLDRAQGRGFGRRMMAEGMDRLRRLGSPGVHLGVSVRNEPAQAFYRKLGFRELIRVGSATDGVVYMGKAL